jgi:hypothetical protein
MTATPDGRIDVGGRPAIDEPPSITVAAHVGVT